MNFSTFHRLPITGHKDIDFVDIRLETDTSLYVDPERIALSNHPISASASHCIDDFFATLCQVAAEFVASGELLYEFVFDEFPVRGEFFLGGAVFGQSGLYPFLCVAGDFYGQGKQLVVEIIGLVEAEHEFFYARLDAFVFVLVENVGYLDDFCTDENAVYHIECSVLLVL